MSDENVAAQLLADASSGPGPYVALVVRAKAARELTPTLALAMERFEASDRTMGRVSKALCYSCAMPRSRKREHADLIRLIRGGFVGVFEVRGVAPEGSNAKRDCPFATDRYYEMRRLK